jgi:transcriptional regulator with XRE-family HTH domain
MEDLFRRLGQRIRELRILRGFTSQEKFADYCGVHRTFMGHLETGRKDFRLTTIIRVSEALGISLSELFVGVGGESTTTTLRDVNEKADTKHHDVDRSQIMIEVAVIERAVHILKSIAKPHAEGPVKSPKSPKSP